MPLPFQNIHCHQNLFILHSPGSHPPTHSFTLDNSPCHQKRSLPVSTLSPSSTSFLHLYSPFSILRLRSASTNSSHFSLEHVAVRVKASSFFFCMNHTTHKPVQNEFFRVRTRRIIIDTSLVGNSSWPNKEKRKTAQLPLMAVEKQSLGKSSTSPIWLFDHDPSMDQRMDIFHFSGTSFFSSSSLADFILLLFWQSESL